MNTDLLESIKSERHDVVHITEPQEPSSITIRSFNDTTLYSLMMAILKNVAHSEDPLDAALVDDLIGLEGTCVTLTTNDGYLERLDVHDDDWVLIFSNEKPTDQNKGKCSLTIRDRKDKSSINLESASLDNLLSRLNTWLAAD